MNNGLVVAAFLSGLLGSSHCAAMCGPIVGVFENRRNPAGELSNLTRRGCYQLGRLGFYLTLGAMAGIAGAGITLPLGVDWAALALRLVAATVLILLGLRLALGVAALRYVDLAGSSIWKRMSPLAKHVLPMSSAPRALGAGFIWGALPCGLVYGVLVLAATAGDALSSAMVMTAFWAGTLPVLVGSASILSAVLARPNFRRLGGWSMVSLGVLAIALLLPISDVDRNHHDRHSLQGSQPISVLAIYGDSEFKVTGARVSRSKRLRQLR